MKGLFGKSGFEIELRTYEEPAWTDHSVRIKVNACGLCGTDLHFLRDMDEFTPMGHEISAVVAETGAAVTRVKKGDTVICEDVTMCGSCPECKSGRINFCRNGYTLEGQCGMADEMVVHENMLHVFTGIDPVTASMVEPLAVAIRGVNKLELKQFDSVAVFGMGSIGLFAAAYAKLIGAGRIVMIARNSESMRNRKAAEIAKDYGADEIYYSDDPAYIEKMLEKGAFDAAVVAAPPSVCADAMKILDYGGKAVALGVTFGAGACAEIDVNDMVFNKKQLLTSIAEPAMNFPLSIRLIQSGRIDAAKVITHRIPMEDAGMIKELYAKDAPAIKTVVIPG